MAEYNRSYRLEKTIALVSNVQDMMPDGLECLMPKFLTCIRLYS